MSLTRRTTYAQVRLQVSILLIQSTWSAQLMSQIQLYFVPVRQAPVLGHLK